MSPRLPLGFATHGGGGSGCVNCGRNGSKRCSNAHAGSQDSAVGARIRVGDLLSTLSNLAQDGESTQDGRFGWSRQAAIILTPGGCAP